LSKTDLPQPGLPFTRRVEGPPPYRESAEQAALVTQLRRFIARMKASPSGLTTVIVIGPKGCGKTRALREAQRSATPLDAVTLDTGDIGPLDLFGEINRAAAARIPLVLENRKSLRRWFEEHDDVPPDLLSRLGAVPLLPLDRPQAGDFIAPLSADLALHGLRLSAPEIASVAERLPRDFGAVRAFCEALDQAPPHFSRRELLQWGAEKVHVLMQEGDGERGE
jgi:hypothetical protein